MVRMMLESSSTTKTRGAISRLCAMCSSAFNRPFQAVFDGFYLYRKPGSGSRDPIKQHARRGGAHFKLPARTVQFPVICEDNN